MTLGPLFSGRVLHVSRVGYLGGAERVLLTIATCSRQFGAEPMVVSPPGEVQDLARAEGLAAHPISAAHLRVTSNPFLLMRYYLELRTVQKEVAALCRAQGADVIHAHHPLGALYCKEAVRDLGIPLVLHLHEGLPAKSLYLRALRQAAHLASRVISVSSVGTELLRLAGADASRAVVIRNGIDIAQVTANASPAAPEVNGRGPHIGVFGVVERRKGHHVLLRGAADILARQPAAQFWIVGGSPSPQAQDYSDEIVAQARELGIEGSVHFIGHRPDVFRWMKAMDVVVSSSIRHESLSMVALEAMALGKLVVATQVGGIGEAIQDGVCGFLAPPDDPGALAGAIERALRSPDRRRIESEAVRTVRERFSSVLQCREVISVYRDIAFAKRHKVR